MTGTVFLRLLELPPEEKGRQLARISETLREKVSAGSLAAVFVTDTNNFSVVPGSPFAYWVGESLWRIFRACPPLEGNAGRARVGLQTGDDFRYIRTRWEVDPRRIGYSPEHTDRRRGWVHFAKGGSYLALLR